MIFGVDRLFQEPRRLPDRLGLVTNHAARLATNPAVPSRVALKHAGLNVVRLFVPEHGLDANAADGHAVADGRDALTDLPVVSLYGEQMRPPKESIADLDAVLFDIPDIGARFYTYIWTLSHVLEACATEGVPLIVLDRPNPLGGDLSMAEGAGVDTTCCRSFIGRFDIPIRHSLTVGELARVWSATIPSMRRAKVEVMRCEGWHRRQHWPDTRLPFVPTSPAIASYASALTYPGICFGESTNLSVGRGTDTPFQLFAAPWLDATRIAGRLNDRALPGASFQAVTTRPTQPPYLSTPCFAVHVAVTDPKVYRPVCTGLTMLAEIAVAHRAEFRWMPYPTAANPSGDRHFELLLGREGEREKLMADPLAWATTLGDLTDASSWAERVTPYLLYEQ